MTAPPSSRPESASALAAEMRRWAAENPGWSWEQAAAHLESLPPAPRPPGGGELLAARVELELELEQLFIDSERGIGESAGTQAERAMKLLVEFTGSDWLCRACGAVNGGQRDDDYRPNPSAGELPAASLRELPAKWRARRDRAAANPTQGNAGAGLAWESAAAQLEAALAEEPAPPAPAEVEAAVAEALP